MPERFFDEMRGIADGAGVDVQDVDRRQLHSRAVSLLGFRAGGSATKDGTLYHGRILDYGCDWRLQEHAVLTVAEPRGKIPFVNVTYAGFVGSVTGMNAERVSIGEMGGRGMGHWDGVPMAFLVRMVLEEANTPRPRHRDLPRSSANLRILLRDCRRQDRQGGRHGGLAGTPSASSPWARAIPGCLMPIKDAVVLSAGDRYKELVEASREGHRQVRRRVGPAPDGPAGGHEVEPAQRLVRDHHDTLLGRQRLERRQTGRPSSRITHSQLQRSS